MGLYFQKNLSPPPINLLIDEVELKEGMIYQILCALFHPYCDLALEYKTSRNGRGKTPYQY